MEKLDKEEIRRSCELLIEPGSTVELRIPRTSRGTKSGYFDEPEKLVEAAATVSGHASGVYLTINPVNKDLLARAVNHLTEHAKHTTSDIDILQRRWLPLDFDPVRPAGVSSTDSEHQAAIETARHPTFGVFHARRSTPRDRDPVRCSRR